MTKKVAALMNQIDEVLAEGTSDSADVWALLTALRGPDNKEAMQKHRTTSVLRAKVFPKLAMVAATDWTWPNDRPFVPGMNRRGALPDQAMAYDKYDDATNTYVEQTAEGHAAVHFNEALKAFHRKDPDALPNPAQQPDVPGA